VGDNKSTARSVRSRRTHHQPGHKSLTTLPGQDDFHWQPAVGAHLGLMQHWMSTRSLSQSVISETPPPSSHMMIRMQTPEIPSKKHRPLRVAFAIEKLRRRIKEEKNIVIIKEAGIAVVY
jgi:hypothetical protein